MHRARAAIQQVRCASTSSHAFPFPAHSHPTPHQIFHLSPGAGQQDIKSRYYELVRAHHPDSPHCRALPSSVRHTQFQAITNAYDVLRGKKAAYNDRFDPAGDEFERRRRYQMHNLRSRAYDGAGAFGYDYGPGASQRQWTASADDRWKDRVIVCFGVLSLVAALAPAVMLGGPGQRTHMSAASNLAQARAEAREFGQERRAEIRRRVREQRQQAAEDGRIRDQED